VALIQERPIDDVTVQDVLDRASVGRSTFYLHFRDKDDLLLSQLEKFLETMSTALSIQKEESHRVVPVAELFAHIGSQKKLYRVLADSGRLNDFLDLAQGYFARGIERRLTESKRLSNLPQRELGPRASALAGSMLSLLQWWLDRGAKESPRAMDELFHPDGVEGTSIVLIVRPSRWSVYRIHKYCPSRKSHNDSLKYRIFLRREPSLLPLLLRDSSALQWFRANGEDESIFRIFHRLRPGTTLRLPLTVC
jgi:AcrR family transcriptional regulator